MKNFWKYRLVLVVTKLFSYLPLSILRFIGAGIGLCIIQFSKRSNKRVTTNLLATGICNTNDIKKCKQQVAKEFGKTLIEIISIVWQRSKQFNANLIVKVTNYELIEKVASHDKPILFLTTHMSNFEIALKYTATKINRMFTVLYKPSKSEWINKLMYKGREECNIKPVPITRKGIFTLTKDLRNGGLVGLLPDSVASAGDGVWVDFFNKPVFATSLAAKLLLTTPDVNCIIVATYRVKGGFEVEYIPFVPSSTDITSVVQDIYYIIEKIVLKAPEQYYWNYDRFRVPVHAKIFNEE